MLAEAVETAARDYANTLAFSRGEITTTWSELDRASRSAAWRLSNRVNPGDVVALCMDSTERWVIAATAVNRLGGVIAGVSPVVTEAERAKMLEVLCPSLVLADRTQLAGLPLRCRVVEFTADGLGPTHDHDPVGVPICDRDADDDFAICFTSGTTGSPKAARFTIGAVRAVHRIDWGAVGRTTPGTQGPHVISSTQFAHVGFVLKLVGHALAGSTIHVMQRWSASQAISLIEDNSVRTLGVVAPQLALILSSPAIEAADLSSLQTVIAGGAPSPAGLIERARAALGVDYSIRWSSTESGGVGLAALVDDDHPEAIGTIGVPREGVEARVAPEDPHDRSATCRRDEIGELQVRSDAQMAGYVGDDRATADAFTADGWLRTGDLAYVRSDGRFVLAGRRNDMYIRGGYNVYPSEVEEALGTHPLVGDVAIAPRPDALMGHVGVAVVVPRGGRVPTLDSLRDHGARTLSKHKLPEAIVVVASLPMTSAGKLDRSRLESVVASDSVPEPTDPESL